MAEAGRATVWCGRWSRGIAAVVGLVLVAACGAEGRSSKGGGPDGAGTLHQQFSGERALKVVEQIVAYGPRPPGSEALEGSRQHLEKALAELGWTTQRQEFHEQTPIGRTLFVNLRARYAGTAEAGDAAAVWTRPIKVLMGGHYDTKYYRRLHFVGANDGGSSTGLLVEMARVLAMDPAAARQVEIIFFDGEEAFVQYTPTDGLFGSRFHARWVRSQPPEQWPGAVVIFDMVGDRDLRISLPSNVSPELAGQLFESAEALGLREFFGSRGGPIIDDHVPFEQLGIPTINLIDLDYAVWHTPEDTMDKLSADSLRIVGATGLHLVENHLLAPGR